MRDRVRIKSHGPNGVLRTTVVGGVDGVGQNKLGFTFGCINLDGKNHGWSNQNPAVPWLGDNKRTLLNAISAAECGRNDNCPPLAKLGQLAVRHPSVPPSASSHAGLGRSQSPLLRAKWAQDLR